MVTYIHLQIFYWALISKIQSWEDELGTKISAGVGNHPCFLFITMIPIVMTVKLLVLGIVFLTMKTYLSSTCSLSDQPNSSIA